jgi:succinyl-CoA synthetase alpha subunit
MSILIDRSTRVVVQGITGRDGSFHTRQMLDYGTKVVAGVTPGKGGQKVESVPVFDTMAEATRHTGANTSVIYVPPKFAIDALYEAADSGVGLVICITEGIPAVDMLKVNRYYETTGVRLVGPNCPGVITPGVCKVGIMPGHIHRKGTVGVVSRSGTLTYEVVYHLTNSGMGQSTCIGIGGDMIIGLRFVEVLSMFEQDRQTEAVVLIGEIGGNDEEVAAEYIQRQMTKPVVSFIAGRTAPPGKRMGHAGAIIAGGSGTASEKIAALRAAGVEVAESPGEIAEIVACELKKRAVGKGGRIISTTPRARAAAKTRKGTRKTAPAKTKRTKITTVKTRTAKTTKAKPKAKPRSAARKTTKKKPAAKKTARKSTVSGAKAKRKPASKSKAKTKPAAKSKSRKKPATKTRAKKKPKTSTKSRPKRTVRKPAGKTKKKR